MTERGPALLDRLDGVGRAGAGPAASSPIELAVVPDDRERVAAEPVDIGSVTHSTAAAAIAASTALPPARSIRRPARVARGWLVAIMASAAYAGRRPNADRNARGAIWWEDGMESPLLPTVDDAILASAMTERDTTSAALPVPRIDGDRLWQSLMALAEVGPAPGGGSHRVALTDADRDGQVLFTSWAEAAGCTVTRDRIGNLFAERPGADPSRPAVFVGSHLDTQPNGGRFDGPYGVLAGLEIVRTLADHDLRTLAPLVVVSWANEEGARFPLPTTGSGVFSGTLALEDALEQPSHDGPTLRSRARPPRPGGRCPGRGPAGGGVLRGAHRAGHPPRGRRRDDRRGTAGPGPAGVARDDHGQRRPTRVPHRWTAGGMRS